MHARVWASERLCGIQATRCARGCTAIDAHRRLRQRDVVIVLELNGGACLWSRPQASGCVPWPMHLLKRCAHLRSAPFELPYRDEVVGLPVDLRQYGCRGHVGCVSGEALGEHRGECGAAMHQAELLHLHCRVREHLHRQGEVRRIRGPRARSGFDVLIGCGAPPNGA